MKYKVSHIIIFIILECTCSLKLPESSRKVTRSLLRARNPHEDKRIPKTEASNPFPNGNSKRQEFNSCSSAGFPEVEYPTTIYDTFTPFYYKNKGCTILGPFAFNKKPKVNANEVKNKFKLDEFLINLKAQCENKSTEVNKENVREDSEANVTNSTKVTESSQLNLEENSPSSYPEGEKSNATIIEIIITNNSTQEDQTGIIQKLNIIEDNNTYTLIENEQMVNATDEPIHQNGEPLNITELIRKIIKEELDQRDNTTETNDILVEDLNQQNVVNASTNEEAVSDKFTITIDEISLPMQIATDNCTYLVTEGSKIENNNTGEIINTTKIISLINEIITAESTNKSDDSLQTENQDNNDISTHNPQNVESNNSNYPEIIKIVIKTDQVNVEPNITIEEIIDLNEEPLTNIITNEVEGDIISESTFKNPPFTQEQLNNTSQIYDNKDADQNINEMKEKETSDFTKTDLIFESPESVPEIMEQISDVNKKIPVDLSETIVNEEPKRVENITNEEKHEAPTFEDILISATNDTREQTNVTKDNANIVGDQEQSTLEPNQVNNTEVTGPIPSKNNMSMIDMPINEENKDESKPHKNNDKQELRKQNTIESDNLSTNESLPLPIKQNVTTEKILQESVIPMNYENKTVEQNKNNENSTSDAKLDILTQIINDQEKMNGSLIETITIVPENDENVTFTDDSLSPVNDKKSTVDPIDENSSKVMKQEGVSKIDPTVFKLMDTMANNISSEIHKNIILERENTTKTNQKTLKNADTSNATQKMDMSEQKHEKTNPNMTEILQPHNNTDTEHVNPLAPINEQAGIQPIVQNLTSKNNSLSPTTKKSNTEIKDTSEDDKSENKTLNLNTADINNSNQTEIKTAIEEIMIDVQNTTKSDNNSTIPPEVNDTENTVNSNKTDTKDINKDNLKNVEENKTKENDQEKNDLNIVQLEVLDENDIPFNSNESLNDHNFMNKNNQTYKEDSSTESVTNNTNNDQNNTNLNNNNNTHSEENHDNNFDSIQNPTEETQDSSKTNDTETHTDDKNQNVESISDVIKKDAKFFETFPESEQSDDSDYDEDIYSNEEDDLEPETETEGIER